MASKLIFFIICAAVVLTTLLYGAVHQPVLSLFYISASLVLLLWAFESLMTGKFRFSSSLTQIPLIAIALFGIIQVIPLGSLADAAGVSGIARTISFEPFSTKNAVVQFVALLIYFAAMLAFIDSAARLRKIIFLIGIFGFAYAFFAILQGVLSPGKIYGIYEPRISNPYGSFINRHNFAAIMEMTIAVPLGMLLAGAVSKDKRLLYVTAIVLMGIAVLLSGSRGGLVALVAEVLMLFFIASKARTYGQIVFKIAIAVLFIATLIGGSILIGGESSLTRIAETAQSNDLTSNRSHIWNITFEIIKNYPLFGVGLAAFPQAYTQFDTLNGLERVEQAHNDFLQVLSDAGIVGLLIGGFFLFVLFRTGFAGSNTKNTFRRGAAIGALAGCFAVLVHSFFDFVLHTTAVAVMFLLLCAIVVVSGRKFEDDVAEFVPKKRKERQPASVTSIEERKAKIQELIKN